MAERVAATGVGRGQSARGSVTPRQASVPDLLQRHRYVITTLRGAAVCVLF